MGELYCMGRIIFVKQYPSKLRYQEFFSYLFPAEFKKYFSRVIEIGVPDKLIASDMARNLFSPVKESILFEQQQVREFLNLQLEDNDILFLADLSFPGFFSNVLYHKPVENAFAFCHGTSLNTFDYFYQNRSSKWDIETGHSKLFKKVFVATEYHKKKLGWENIEVVGLPDTPFDGYHFEKKYDIISVARPSIQKVNKRIESEIEEEFGKIERANCDSWARYYRFLSQGKVLLSTAKEETFGYQILEAIKNNSIPIAPDRFSYPELLPKEYLYNNIEQLKEIIRLALDGKLSVPALLNQNLVSSFFENICSIMKRESHA
jgi:hypothetical protein